MKTISAALVTLACAAPAAWAGPVETLAIELGLTPQLLAISGFNATEAGTVLANLDAAETERGEFEGLQDQAIAIADDIRAVVDQIRDDPGNATLRSELATLGGQLASAQAAEATAEAALVATALDGQNQAKIDELVRCGDNCWRYVPSQMLALAWEPEELRQLEAALTAETRSDRTGEPLRTAFEDVLQTARANAAVVQAQVRLDNNLQALISRFAQ